MSYGVALRNGVPFTLGTIAALCTNATVWSPLALFAASEKGGLYDFTQLANLYQDNAGATPCTAVGQPIGLVLDTSGNGNHASQATPTKRPILGRMPETGVGNRLTYTDNAYDTRGGWSPGSGCTVTNDALTQSGVTLSSVVPTTSTSSKGAYLGATPGVFSFYVKANGYRYTQVYDAGSATLGSLVFDAVAGVFSLNSLSIPVSVTSLGGGLFRVSVVVAVQMSIGVGVCISGTPGSNYGNYQQTGDGVSGLYLGSFQLELGSTATAYQKVGAVYDVTESGVASVYAAYADGIDDALVTSAIDFTATDAATVFAGFRKTSDAARGMVLELSATTASNNGSFALTAPNAASATIVYESKGTSLTDTSATVTAPANSIITAQTDISADTNILRRNGAQAESDTGDQGTGNFGNYPLYIGQRGASNLPYRGFLSLLCVRGAASTTDEISDMEAYMEPKTPGVTLP